jgi:rsbT co-antagonist protein RsbR
VYDGEKTVPDSLLHTSNKEGGSAPRMQSASTLDIAGRTWTIVATSRREFEAGSTRRTALYLLFGGIVVSVLLFGATRSLAKARTLAEQSAVDLRKSEQSLRASEQHLRNVLDGISTYVGVMRPDGTLIEANRAMLAAASLRAEDVADKAFEEAYWWSYSEDARKQLRAAIERAREGETVRYDAPMRLAEDRFLTVELAITPLRDSTGRVHYLIPTCTDITKRLEGEKERARLHEEIIGMQAARLAELSTPLIPLSREVVLMPLIGSLDALRAQQVLNAVSLGLVSASARFAILDITGVPAVDTEVARLLIQTAQVVRMLGAELVLTGIKPAVAQTIVRMGVDLGGIVTRNDLQSGIAYAMGRHR